MKTLTKITLKVLFIFLMLADRKTSYCQSATNCNSRTFYDIGGKAYIKITTKGKVTKIKKWIFENGKEIVLYNKPDNEASLFNDDKKAWKKFLMNNLSRPNSDSEGSIQLVLLIDEKGKIMEKRILKEIPGCKECNETALHLIEKLPAWMPAILNGKSIKSTKYLFIPIGEFQE